MSSNSNCFSRRPYCQNVMLKERLWILHSPNLILAIWESRFRIYHQSCKFIGLRPPWLSKKEISNLICLSKVLFQTSAPHSISKRFQKFGKVAKIKVWVKVTATFNICRKVQKARRIKLTARPKIATWQLICSNIQSQLLQSAECLKVQSASLKLTPKTFLIAISLPLSLSAL